MTNVVHKFRPNQLPHDQGMSARERKARAIGSRQIRNLHTEDGRARSKYLNDKLKQLQDTQNHDA